MTATCTCSCGTLLVSALAHVFECVRVCVCVRVCAQGFALLVQQGKALFHFTPLLPLFSWEHMVDCLMDSSTTSFSVCACACAGQDRFSQLTHVYFRDAAACIVVFDLTDESTLHKVKSWMSEVDAKLNEPNQPRIPCILLANKVTF